ncbi:hypothetical protein V1264_019122 [Littorina saxatilis]|uniref:Uncharacterized protein n=1 Tax=Littorina saxatilis TaxID=31220 RepID=A0AAN9BFA7_9CAEN
MSIQHHRLCQYSTTGYVDDSTTGYVKTAPQAMSKQHHRLCQNSTTGCVNTAPQAMLMTASQAMSIQHHRLCPYNTTGYVKTAPQAMSIQHHRLCEYSTTDYVDDNPTGSLRDSRSPLLMLIALSYHLDFSLLLERTLSFFIWCLTSFSTMKVISRQREDTQSLLDLRLWKFSSCRHP